MPNRREVIAGALAAAALSRVPVALAKPSQPSTKVAFDVPPGACDCHTPARLYEF